MFLTEASPVYEELPMYFCNNNFDVLGGSLLSFCNKSMQEGVFPHDFKNANVICIFFN